MFVKETKIFMSALSLVILQGCGGGHLSRCGYLNDPDYFRGYVSGLINGTVTENSTAIEVRFDAYNYGKDTDYPTVDRVFTNRQPLIGLEFEVTRQDQVSDFKYTGKIVDDSPVHINVVPGQYVVRVTKILSLEDGSVLGTTAIFGTKSAPASVPVKANMISRIEERALFGKNGWDSLYRRLEIDSCQNSTYLQGNL
jgi:hypothetical protein